MKFQLLIITILIFSSNSFGQKCNYLPSKKDEFTGESIKAVKTEIRKQWFYWTSTQKGDKYLIDLNFAFGGEYQNPMRSGDSIMVKLQNGKLITLKLTQDIEPKATVVYLGINSTPNVLTFFNPTFEVNKDILEDLSKSLVTTIRIHLDKSYDYDFTQKNSDIKGCERLMTDVKCILY